MRARGCSLVESVRPTGTPAGSARLNFASAERIACDAQFVLASLRHAGAWDRPSKGVTMAIVVPAHARARALAAANLGISAGYIVVSYIASLGSNATKTIPIGCRTRSWQRGDFGGRKIA